MGVLSPVAEASFVAVKLTELGGAAEAYEVPDEDLEEAHTAATAEKP